MKTKIFVARKIPEVGLLMLAEHFEVKTWEGELPPSPEELKENIAEVQGLLALLTDKVDAALLDCAPKLCIVSNYAVGYDNLDLPALTERGIMATNTPGVLTETTADLAFALLMSSARRVVEGVQYVKDGKWRTWGPRLLVGQDIYGATLGIVGLGRIGLAVARRAKGFNMRIWYFDTNRNTEAEAELGLRFVTLEELLRISDFVTLHTPLTNETRHLINRESLRLMKHTAILINTARGPIVDEEALYEVLAAGQLAGAALDVTDPEPMRVDSPLLTLENVIVVPHIASASHATRNKMATMAAANLIAGLNGERPPNLLNEVVLGRLRN